ncbi:MAG: DUF3786 domain-containing protein [Desulfobacteraceae bacterium]|nr:MAG: DUF3786 domain-containing protein [Desulfobacteraceae bacterium]
MPAGYGNLIEENLAAAFEGEDYLSLAVRLEGKPLEDGVALKALGKRYEIRPEGLYADGVKAEGPEAVVVSLYASHASSESIKTEPFMSFKDFPGSMPYHGAFAANAETILIPHAVTIGKRINEIAGNYDGEVIEKGDSGDLSVLLYPFPKICLRYIFYMPDEDFPASATCLFSSNALSFLPLDGLADVAEYTSRGIVKICMSRGL